MPYRRVLACGLAVAWLAAPPAAPAAAVALPAPQPSWSFGLRSTGYAYQAEDTAGATTDHARLYQHFAGTAAGLAGGRLGFRVSGRFANLPSDAGPLFEQSRLHTGVMEARLGARMRAEAGRQFLQAGVTGLTLDGARLAWRGARGTEASVWAEGTAAPPTTSKASAGRRSRSRGSGALRPGGRW
ncbi:MAG: hypothetical protein IH621_06595 [Krumholzibacteria bacterium]|nr:hypothetical protein [Candidatus Krumholzibacteria bacterium]